MSDNVWVFWSTKDAMNPMQNIKKGHSMRKIVGILVQPLVSYFLQLIYMYCAFPCIHNSSINVYAQHCHALYVLSTFLHWLHVTVEYGMSWKRYECAVNDCFATLNPCTDNKTLHLADCYKRC